MTKRETARKKFEDTSFDQDATQGSLQAIQTRTLARYDAEISWYDRHADRRRFFSGTIRCVAVLFGTLSLVLINIRAFSTPTDALVSLELTTIATAGAIVAGGVLLLDTVFQVTARYGRWRVAEYAIRVMRSTFESEFFEKYGAKQEQEIDLAMFNQARIMAIERFKTVEEEIKAETESWQEGLDKAMTTLRQKIEETAEEVKKASGEVTKVDKDRQDRDREEAEKREPVLLDVKIEPVAERPASMLLVIRDKRKREVGRETGKPGQELAFSLPPGPYTVHLLGPADEQINAKSQRLTPAKDASLVL